MPDYGLQILKNAFFDCFYKQKNWVITRIQYKVLNVFGRMPRFLKLDQFFSRLSRKLVGAYLYSVKLEVNRACTLNCKMCYIENSNEEIPFGVIKTLLDDIKSYRIRLEILGGEPLLRKDIIEIISYAKRVSGIPFVSLYTNALAADKMMALKLKKAGLDAAIVTLVSHHPEIHDAFTGQKGSWMKTVRNIGCLKDAGVPVYTFTAIHRDNYRDYRNIYYFVKQELKVKALFYQYVPQKKDDPLMIPASIWHNIKHWILSDMNRPHAEFIGKFYMLTGNACSGGNFVFTIKADGSVQPCPFISDLSLGSIYEQSIWQIFRNRFNLPHLRNFKKIPDECRACSYNSVCGGGCKAGNRLLFGRYDHKDHRCLGPYENPIDKESLIDCIPTFF